MSMTIQEWQRIARHLCNEVGNGVSSAGLPTHSVNLLREHIDAVPTLKDEVLWLVNNWLSKAQRPDPPVKGTLTVHRPPPLNTLKFTDEQAAVLCVVIGRLFDGTLTLNPTTGAMFPVTGNHQRADRGCELSADAIAQPQRGQS